MSNEFDTFPLCDFHDNDEAASTICLTHRKLICLSCSLEKARTSQTCVLRPLSKLTEEKDLALVACLHMKQTVYKKRSVLKEGEMKNAKLNEDLKHKINEFYDKLKRHLNHLKENCVKSLDDMTSDATQKLDKETKTLDSLEREIDEHLKSLGDATASSLTALEAKKSKLMKELQRPTPNPTGHFKPDTSFRDAILENEKGLGEVTVDVYIEDIYDEVGQTGSGDEQDVSDDEKVQQRIPVSRVHEKAVRESREPLKETLPKVPMDSFDNELYMTSPTSENSQTNEFQKNEEVDVPKKTNEKSVKEKKKHHFRLPRFFSKDERPNSSIKIKTIKYHKTSETHSSEIQDENLQEKTHEQEDYEDVTFETSKELQSRYLINKTIKINGLQTKSKEPLCFSKLFPLGKGHVVLLSKPHSTVVIAKLDGSVTCSKQFQSVVVGLVVTGSDQIAVLLEKRGKVIKLDLAKNGLHKKDSFNVQEMFLNITGFDFNEKDSQFAVSSPHKLTVLDYEGNNITTISNNVTDYTKVVTTYDFENECLYVLNIEHQTLKCFSYRKSDAVWRRRFDSGDLKPRDICLHQDKLFVTFKAAIVVFATADGTAVDKHTTSELLDDCLGLCIVDDVIIFSSNSDQYDDSLRIAFLPV